MCGRINRNISWVLFKEEVVVNKNEGDTII